MDEKKACRICLGEGSQPLVSLCNCQGSIAYIHQQCFLKWAQTDRQRNPTKKIFDCQLCLKRIPTNIIENYTISCIEQDSMTGKVLKILLILLMIGTLGLLGYFSYQVKMALNNQKKSTPSQLIAYYCFIGIIIIGFIAQVIAFVLKFLLQKAQFIELAKPKVQNRSMVKIVPLDSTSEILQL